MKTHETGGASQHSSTPVVGHICLSWKLACWQHCAVRAGEMRVSPRAQVGGESAACCVWVETAHEEQQQEQGTVLGPKPPSPLLGPEKLQGLRGERTLWAAGCVRGRGQVGPAGGWHPSGWLGTKGPPTELTKCRKKGLGEL